MPIFYIRRSDILRKNMPIIGRHFSATGGGYIISPLAMRGESDERSLIEKEEERERLRSASLYASASVSSPRLFAGTR